jgi:sulfite exporter TauE/SafE
MLVSGLILGLLGSLHCVGMCGPIAFLLPVSRDNHSLRLVQIGSYHLGRFTAYGLLGLVFGFLGKGLSLFGAQQYLSIIAGVLLLLTVAIPQRILFKHSLSKPLALAIGKLKSALGQALKSKRPDTFLTLGLLNGFLPCGLVYMAVFGSLALANPWQGSLYMVLFGLGTLPLMTGAIYAGNFLNKTIQLKIRKAIPVMVALIACLFILRGLGLGIPYVSPKLNPQKIEAKIECH